MKHENQLHEKKLATDIWMNVIERELGHSNEAFAPKIPGLAQTVFLWQVSQLQPKLYHKQYSLDIWQFQNKANTTPASPVTPTLGPRSPSDQSGPASRPSDSAVSSSALAVADRDPDNLANVLHKFKGRKTAFSLELYGLGFFGVRIRSGSCKLESWSESGSWIYTVYQTRIRKNPVALSIYYIA